MATADELLSTLDTDKTLIIDKDLRIITIPSSVKNLGVESDDDVLRLKFSMPRMYGDVDLSDFSIYINYMNAKNTGDVYVVDDKTIADDTITFSWLVGRVALAYKGNVRFIVCMKKHDDNSNVIQEYNTTIASLPVLEGLETGETVIQQNPDIIEMLLTSSEPLIGTTRNITPSRVLAAIKAGRDVALQYTDSYYGAFVFSAFNANERLGIVVSNSILPQMNGLTGTLLGFVEDNAWDFKATNTATTDSKLPNPYPLTFTGAVSGSYDGSSAKTITIPSGGGSEKELTLLADINFDGNTANGFEYTGLNDVSEIYIVGAEIKSGLDNSESRFSLKINDIEISAGAVLNIQKASGTDTWNNYYIAKFNGAFWESLRSPNHAGASPVGHMIAPLYPNSVVLDVGKAKKLYLYVANPSYKPVAGWMKIWVR